VPHPVLRLLVAASSLKVLHLYEASGHCVL